MSNFICNKLFFKKCHDNCKYYHLGDIFYKVLPVELIDLIDQYLKPKDLTNNYIDSILFTELPYYCKLKNKKNYFKSIDRFIGFDTEFNCLICHKEVSAWDHNKEYLCENYMLCEDMWYKTLKYCYDNNYFSKFKKEYFKFCNRYCLCENNIYECIECYKNNLIIEIEYLQRFIEY